MYISMPRLGCCGRELSFQQPDTNYLICRSCRCGLKSGSGFGTLFHHVIKSEIYDPSVGKQVPPNCDHGHGFLGSIWLAFIFFFDALCKYFSLSYLLLCICCAGLCKPIEMLELEHCCWLYANDFSIFVFIIFLSSLLSPIDYAFGLFVYRLVVVNWELFFLRGS